jgi:hypothetical protein
VDLLQHFMGDEAWFHLSGYLNSHNSRLYKYINETFGSAIKNNANVFKILFRYWATENLHIIHEAPLHDQVGVWCALSGHRIVGPIFLRNTISSDEYPRILDGFYVQLIRDERLYYFFQQRRCYAPHIPETIGSLA